MRTTLPVITLTARGEGPAGTADIRLTVGEQPVHLQVTVPTGDIPLRDVLPVFQGFTNIVMDVAEAAVQREGKSVSCRKGCGACCRQVVPISPSEAHALARLVEVMPEPRRTLVRERFGDARRRLEASGLAGVFRKVDESFDSAARGLEYFRLGIACPFLEEESCSIHPDRPVACREYLVTSPAENCSNPSPETVKCVPLPAKVGRATRAVEWATTRAAQGWLPLVLALEWAETNPEAPPRPGPAWVKEFFEWLATGEITA
jgi:Fe-S-cluster containining protein